MHVDSHAWLSTCYTGTMTDTPNTLFRRPELITRLVHGTDPYDGTLTLTAWYGDNDADSIELADWRQADEYAEQIGLTLDNYGPQPDGITTWAKVSK